MVFDNLFADAEMHIEYEVGEEWPRNIPANYQLEVSQPLSILLTCKKLFYEGRDGLLKHLTWNPMYFDNTACTINLSAETEKHIRHVKEAFRKWPQAGKFPQLREWVRTEGLHPRYELYPKKSGRGGDRTWNRLLIQHYKDGNMKEVMRMIEHETYQYDELLTEYSTEALNRIRAAYRDANVVAYLDISYNEREGCCDVDYHD
ncbi:hypothetical protein LTR66_017349, partial [Elasticomyces elasticus]